MRSFILRLGSCLVAFLMIGLLAGQFLTLQEIVHLDWKLFLLIIVGCFSFSIGFAYLFSEWVLAPLFYWFRRASTLPIGKVLGSDSEVKKMTEWYFLRDHFAYMKQTIASQHQELKQKTLESQEAQRLKVDFVRNMSHHLRTPLNNMIGACHLLNEESSNNELQKIAFYNAQDISHLIESLMNLAEMDSAMLRVFPQWGNLQELVHKSIQEVLKTTDFSYQDLPLQLSENLQQQVFIDPILLQRMVSVLTRTCLRSFPQGVQSIHANVDSGSFLFSIETNDIDLSEDNLKHLLDRFPPIGSQYAQQYPLLSVHLCLVKELAEFCDGSLTTAFVGKNGLHLELKLSLNKEVQDSKKEAEEQWGLLEEVEKDIEQVEAILESQKDLSNSAKESYRILIAEDNQENRFVFEQYLTHRPDHQYQVIFAADGVQALEKAQSENPDLIMMDIMMPNMGGIEAAKQIKANPKLREIPLIAVTSMASGEDQECIEQYVDAYLSKPVMAESLYQTLDQLLA